MADYSLVVNSSFSPLSFQDWLAPAAMDTAEHKEIQKELADLNANANTWASMISPDNDPGTNAVYQNYVDALQKRADNLQRYGLNYNTRQSMYDIKARYNSEIKPIETAFNRRRELSKSQADAISKDPTHMFQRDASKMSLDTFISDPEANYGWETSGALLASQVSQAAKALAKELRSSNGREILKSLGIPYMYELITKKGFSSEEILQAIRQDPNASPILSNIIEDTLRASGVYGTQDAGLINKAREYANLGLWDAIGDTSNQVLTDNYGIQMAKMPTQSTKSNNSEDPENPELTVLGAGIPSRHLMIGVSPTEIDKNVEKYDKYFDHNTGQLTPEGRKEFYRITAKTRHGQHRSAFRQFLEDELGVVTNGWIDGNVAYTSTPDGTKVMTDWDPEAIYQAYKDYSAGATPHNADTMRYTEYVYPLDTASATALQNRVKSAQNGHVLTEVKFSDGKYSRTKNTMTMDTFGKSTILDVGFSAFGLIIKVEDDSSNMHTFELPIDVDSNMVGQIKTAIQKLGPLQEEAVTGKTSSGRDLTDQEKLKVTKDYNVLLQQIQSQIAQLCYANDTKKQQFEVSPTYIYTTD